MQAFVIGFHFVRLTSLAAFALAAGCAATEGALKEKGAKALSGAELRSTFASAGTMRWVNARNNSFTSVFTEPDKWDVAWSNGGRNGFVRFTSDGYCSRYASLRNGQEECYRVYRTGDKELTVFQTDGTFNARITLKP